MTSTEAKQIYEDKGVVLIPDVFRHDEIRRMRGNAYLALSYAGDSQHNYLQTRGEWPALLFWPATSNAYLNQIRNDPRLVQIVRAFLGDNVRQVNNQLYFRFPGDGDSFAWHQDIRFRPHITDPSAYLQTIIVIDKITASNSPIEFIEGSADLDIVIPNDDLREFQRHGLQGTPYLANPGDVLVWSLTIWHGSEHNTSEQSRLTYMNGFCHADALDDGWPLYIENGKPVNRLP